MTHEDSIFYRRIGICPKCQKNVLMGDEKSCPECRAKDATYKALLREYNREEYNSYMRSYHRHLYEERKRNNICTTCGKRNAESGYQTCDMCRSKRLNRRRVKNCTKSRFERGLCRFCDNPVEKGYKVCEHHHRMNIEKANNEKSKKARQINRNIILQ